MQAAANQTPIDVPDAYIERNVNFVEITVPRYNECQFRSHFWVNRNVFQVVCDKDLLFLDVFTGYDSRVFRNSDLVGVASNLPPEFHVIGDSAYPLCDYLLVPFRDNGHLKLPATKPRQGPESTWSVPLVC
ncbi:uncharacterized protein [Littorina saxatilis]|uniref:uncharacterized protein n=1 Tax=Littorina saxatilis TaxID=31220 RepID=UPI0038B675D5